MILKHHGGKINLIRKIEDCTREKNIFKILLEQKF